MVKIFLGNPSTLQKVVLEKFLNLLSFSVSYVVSLQRFQDGACGGIGDNAASHAVLAFKSACVYVLTPHCSMLPFVTMCAMGRILKQEYAILTNVQVSRLQLLYMFNRVLVVCLRETPAWAFHNWPLKANGIILTTTYAKLYNFELQWDEILGHLAVSPANDSCLIPSSPSNFFISIGASAVVVVIAIVVVVEVLGAGRGEGSKF